MVGVRDLLPEEDAIQQFSNLIHKFDSMYVTDSTPDMMEGKIFKGWVGRLSFLETTLMIPRVDHTRETFWKSRTGGLS